MMDTGGGVRRGQHLAPPGRVGARIRAPQVGPKIVVPGLQTSVLSLVLGCIMYAL